jgi:hypothetical protein
MIEFDMPPVVNFSARPTYLYIVPRPNGRSRRLAPTLLTAFQIPTRTFVRL